MVGWIEQSPSGPRNAARVFSATVLSQRYDKWHLLPPFESHLVPGSTLTFVRASGGVRVGVAVCKDLDFSGPSRDYGREGAGLLLVPAWDFVDDGRRHARMAVLRGIESGFGVARSARQGLLTVSDSRGRILAEKASGAASFATLVARVPAAHERTVYVRYGDWFAWSALSVAGLSLAALRRSRPRMAPAESER